MFVFRTDSSLNIGSGHVMRCLTLAEALKTKGGKCHFIIREHAGHLADAILKRGFSVSVLPLIVDFSSDSASTYANWLGCDWQTDAQQTGEILSEIKPDWLVVDHYALDQQWENYLRPYYQKLMVIDDLANRPHTCDLLLDQNLGRKAEDYMDLVPAHCKILTGPQNALLRPEFSELRAYSLNKRTNSELNKLLITMGGVDQPNATGRVLDTLKTCILPSDTQITVVMGAAAPWLSQVSEQAVNMPWDTKVLVNISNMAEQMAESDLAIGAAGGTSWERCCLGLPTILVVLAENQLPGAKAMQTANCAHVINGIEDISEQLPLLVASLNQENELSRMSMIASQICDGLGVTRLVEAISI